MPGDDSSALVESAYGRSKGGLDENENDEGDGCRARIHEAESDEQQGTTEDRDGVEYDHLDLLAHTTEARRWIRERLIYLLDHITGETRTDSSDDISDVGYSDEDAGVSHAEFEHLVQVDRPIGGH